MRRLKLSVGMRRLLLVCSGKALLQQLLALQCLHLLNQPPLLGQLLLLLLQQLLLGTMAMLETVHDESTTGST